MELKVLDRNGLEDLYHQELEQVFSDSERRPLAAILRLLEMGRYEALLALEDGEPIGYAMLWRSGRPGSALLEYLGVLRGKRNGGAGSRILAQLGSATMSCSERLRRRIQEIRRRMICAGGASVSMSGTDSGSSTTCAPCSVCDFIACTVGRRWTTSGYRRSTGACTQTIFPRSIWGGISSCRCRQGRRFTRRSSGWRKMRRG